VLIPYILLLSLSLFRVPALTNQRTGGVANGRKNGQAYYAVNKSQIDNGSKQAWLF